MEPSLQAPVQFRQATLEDASALRTLIALSARTLGSDDYTPDQIEGALRFAWAVDTQLIEDGTYFVAVATEIVACGGWSWRRTLFGGDNQVGREPDALDPARDPARIRAFFVHPLHARAGIGRALLQLCEEEATRSGFETLELLATLPGQRLYSSCGYTGLPPQEYPLPGGGTITFVPMSKRLARPPKPTRDGT